MWYGETKVYCDGSHYISIPHTERHVVKKPKPEEEIISIEEDEAQILEAVDGLPLPFESDKIIEEKVENSDKKQKVKVEIKKTKLITKKQLFDTLYTKYINLTKAKRKTVIAKEMRAFFKSDSECEQYVNNNFEKKQRNLICRRIRMSRKANLANFNYFCTFTYDDKKHDEDTFKKSLKTCFRNFCHRKNWKYMGVWERAPKTGRLHFHGLFKIPDNCLPGTLTPSRYYDTVSHKMQSCIQSSYFNERFGRSDFKNIEGQEVKQSLAYIMKYIEKTNEKIVYSKGLPQYFISDILEDDIVTTIGTEDKKLLLFDDFHCLDQGVLIGKVSADVIEQMRKCYN